ncbi:unnamed protein product, partial [Prunus brigantina]
MALALVGAATIGAPFGALYDAVKESMGRTVLRYKSLLGDLNCTLESLRPRIVQQIGDHNVELDLPNDFIERLQRQMEEGIVLFRKLSNIGMWNCYAWGSCWKQHRHDDTARKRREWRASRSGILLKRLKLKEDVKAILLLNKEIRDTLVELDRKMSDLLKLQQE